MNDEGLADVEAASPFRLPRLHPGIVCRIRQAMGLAEGVEHSLGEGACIPPLDLAVPVRVYGAKFGSGDDHL